jgi:hypothetical protein
LQDRACSLLRHPLFYLNCIFYILKTVSFRGRDAIVNTWGV